MSLSIEPEKKLLFAIPSLVEGGTEKVLTNILGHLDKKNYRISLVLFEKKGPYLSQIPEHVKIYDLKKEGRYSFLKLILRLSRLFRKLNPNTVVSFMAYTYIIVLFAKVISGCKFKFITSVRTYLSYATQHSKFSTIRYFFYKSFFNSADFIIVPSKGIKKDLVKNFNVVKKKIKVIYNPIDLNKIMELKQEELEDTRIKERSFLLSIGRLTKAKGYPYLFRAFSRIHNEIKEKLLILGTGEDEEALKSLAIELGIHDGVYFLGFQNNPYKFINMASIFILPSIWEGFPNVILEAMACGVPVISTDCPSGPNEIITNGKNGMLVPPADEEKLADAILTLLRNENIRKKFSEEGIRRVEEFRIEKIIPQYEELF
jgi:glycosyltransferase involved in cell wall biosynthesis